jgi:hypothetical protein
VPFLSKKLLNISKLVQSHIQNIDGEGHNPIFKLFLNNPTSCAWASIKREMVSLVEPDIGFENFGSDGL